jgi:hypothetical protein
LRSFALDFGREIAQIAAIMAPRLAGRLGIMDPRGLQEFAGLLGIVEKETPAAAAAANRRGR